jgi:hypothetical protein
MSDILKSNSEINNENCINSQQEDKLTISIPKGVVIDGVDEVATVQLVFGV